MRTYTLVSILALCAACPQPEPPVDPEDTGDTDLIVIDRDEDGVPASEDCDDNDASLLAVADDGDCDGVPTADDCDDGDALWGARASDEDCDKVLSADDCDDNDDSKPSPLDMDCDGVEIAQDCDDADEAIGACPVGIESISLTQNVDGNDLTVSCPDGKLVVGGGFEGGVLPFWQGMIPSMDGTTWSVKSVGAGSLTAHAVCVNADALPGYEVVKTLSTLEASRTNRSLSSYCPEGKKLLGGGVVVPPAAQASIVGPQAANGDVGNRGYMVQVSNPTFQDKTVDVRAICADVDFTIQYWLGRESCQNVDSHSLLSAGLFGWHGNLWSIRPLESRADASSSGGNGTTSLLCWR